MRGGGGGCGSRQRQVDDGADVVFTDTLYCTLLCCSLADGNSITEGSRCIGVVLVKIEMNVSGSSWKGRDSLSPKLDNTRNQGYISVI